MDDVLKLYVDNTSTSLSGKLRGDLYKGFKKELGFQREDFQFATGGNPHWDGWVSTVHYSREHCKCAIKKDGMHFPTGLISKATQYFRDNNIVYEIVDVRDIKVADSAREVAYELTKTLRDGKPFSLHDYQKEAVTKCVDAQRGIIKVATGGGKTVIAAAVIAAIGVKPAIFYVTSTDLLKQAFDEITQFVKLNDAPITVGAIGGGHKTIADITVMTVQTAIRAVGGKYIKFDDEDDDDKTNIDDIKVEVAELIQSAKLFIADEVQHWAADTCQCIADNSLSARWRYGFSATPWRDKGDDILIDACFGKEIISISASWLIQNNFLVKPFIGFVHVKNMKGERLGAWPSVYKQAVVENDFRNQLIASMAENLVEQKRTLLILINHIPHGESLQQLIPGSTFLHGSCSKKRRGDHLELMRQEKAPVTIASSIFDEGIDVKPLNALILAGGGKSATRALQRVGRVIRPFNYPSGEVKKDAFVYDIYDHQKYLTPHSQQRRRIYSTEPEFDIRDVEL